MLLVLWSFLVVISCGACFSPMVLDLTFPNSHAIDLALKMLPPLGGENWVWVQWAGETSSGICHLTTREQERAWAF